MRLNWKNSAINNVKQLFFNFLHSVVVSNNFFSQNFDSIQLSKPNSLWPLKNISLFFRIFVHFLYGVTLFQNHKFKEKIPHKCQEIFFFLPLLKKIWLLQLYIYYYTCISVATLHRRLFSQHSSDRICLFQPHLFLLWCQVVHVLKIRPLIHLI